MTTQNAATQEGAVIPPYPAIEWSEMTLRDFFAAQALIGLLACDGIDDGKGPFALGDHQDGYAAAAYSVADAMLAAREPRP